MLDDICDLLADNDEQLTLVGRIYAEGEESGIESRSAQAAHQERGGPRVRGSRGLIFGFPPRFLMRGLSRRDSIPDSSPSA